MSVATFVRSTSFPLEWGQRYRLHQVYISDGGVVTVEPVYGAREQRFCPKQADNPPSKVQGAATMLPSGEGLEVRSTSGVVFHRTPPLQFRFV